MTFQAQAQRLNEITIFGKIRMKRYQIFLWYKKKIKQQNKFDFILKSVGKIFYKCSTTDHIGYASEILFISLSYLYKIIQKIIVISIFVRLYNEKKKDISNDFSWVVNI